MFQHLFLLSHAYQGHVLRKSWVQLPNLFPRIPHSTSHLLSSLPERIVSVPPTWFNPSKSALEITTEIDVLIPISFYLNVCPHKVIAEFQPNNPWASHVGVPSILWAHLLCQSMQSWDKIWYIFLNAIMNLYSYLKQAWLYKLRLQRNWEL